MAQTEKFVARHGILTQNIDFRSSDRSDIITAEISNSDELSFTGDNGLLFSLTDNSNKVAAFPGNLLVGTTSDNGSDALQVAGTITATSISADLDYNDITNAPTFDNYVGWELKTEGSSRGTISSGEAVDFQGGVGIALSYDANDNTVIINSTSLGSSEDIFKNIAVSGQTTIEADSNNDTLTFEGGSNVTITTDAATDTVTINAANTDITISAGSTNGPTINSSTGSGAVIPTADISESGVVSTASQTFAGEKTFNDDVSINSTGAIKIPVGAQNQRPTAAQGQIRFNSDLTALEFYNGTNWIELGWNLETDGVDRGTISLGETVNFIGGTNTTLSYNSADNAITIESEDTTFSAGNGISLNGTVFSVAANTGLFQDSDGLSIAENGVTTTELAVTGTGVSNQFLKSNGDGTFAWATPVDTQPSNATITISAGDALATGGSFTLNQSTDSTITLDHADTSSQVSVNNSGGNVIQDVTLDDYGHVTSLTSLDLDNRFVDLVSNQEIDGVKTFNATVNATISGSAASWTTSRTVSFSGGDVTGNFTIDGSADVSNVSLSIVNDAIALGTQTIGDYVQTVSATSATGISVSGSGESADVVITGINAGTTTKGVASFDSNNFSVTSGVVSTKDFSLGSTSLTLGESTTVIDGLNQLSIDNITFDDNTISSTNTNGDIILDPNGFGRIDASTARIINVGAPSQSTDAATKFYVDEVAQGLNVLPSAKAATTSDLGATYDNGTNGIGATLTIGPSASISIDGISDWSIGDNVLVKDQNNEVENGSYVFTQLSNGSTTSWILTRCGFCDEPEEVIGAFEFVQEGTQNGGTGWTIIIDDVDTFAIGTDNIIWYQFSGAGTYTAGAGLVLNGTEFAHGDTSSVADLTSATLTYVDGLTFDEFGHVTDYSVSEVTGTEDNYVDNGTFNTSNGDLTLDRTGGLASVVVNLDGRYITQENDNLNTVTNRGSTTTNSITVGSITANAGATVTGLVDISGQLEIDSRIQFDTDASSITTTTETAVYTFSTSDATSAKFMVEITDNVTSERQLSELIVVYDSSQANAFATEYGVVYSGTSALATFNVDVSSGDVRLLATSASTNSTTYKIHSQQFLV